MWRCTLLATVLCVPFVVGTDDEEGVASSADAFSRLEQVVRELQRDNVLLHQQNEALVKRMAVLEGIAGEESGATPGSSVRKAMDVRSDGATNERRLQSGGPSTFVAAAVPRIVHEFPNGHSCANVDGGYITQLPETGSDGTRWSPSPQWTDGLGEMSLGSVNKDWSTNEIQRFPSPLVVQHDAACALVPSLRLGLNTSVAALSVDGAGDPAGIDVGPRILALEAQVTALLSPPTWLDLPLPTGFGTYTGSSYGTPTPQYTRIGDVVYLRGCVRKDDLSQINDGTEGDTTVGTLPVGYRPAKRTPWLTIINNLNHPACRIFMETSGDIRVYRFADYAIDRVWLHEIRFFATYP